MTESSLPILHDRIRLGLESLCIYQSLQTDSRALALPRHPNFSILGRLASDSSQQTTSPTAGSNSSLFVTGSGLDHQREEVSTGSNSTVRTSRLFIEYPDYDSSPTTAKASGHQTVDQASIEPTSETNSPGYPQSNNENTSSNICNILSSTLYQTPTVLQEPSSQTREGLGSTDSFGLGEHRGASMVVRKSTEMERTLYTSGDSQSDYMCERQQYRMGMQLETSQSTRVLDTSRSLTIDQLARTQSGSSSIEDISTSRELDHFNSDRQHNQLILHQQAGRNSIPATFRISNRSLELVPRPQNNDPGTAHQRYPQHPSRPRVSSNILQEQMADFTFSFSATQPTVGTFLCRSLCKSHNEIITKVRLLAAGFGCYLYGCLLLPMDDYNESLRNNPPWNLISRVLQKIIHNQLSRITLASISFPSGNTNKMSPDTTSIGVSELDALRGVALIRSKVERLQLNDQATKDLLQQRLAPTPTNQGYRKTHLRFLAWAQQHGVSFTEFTSADVINFLADMKQAHSLQVSTLKTMRSAVVHLHNDPEDIRGNTMINSYLDIIARQAPPPVSIHRPTVDLAPVINLAQSILSSTSISPQRLQQKLAFLLAMSAFMRPSDLARIPFASCHISNSVLSLHSAFLTRPSNSNIFFNSNNAQKPLTSSTLSSWLYREFISLCTSEPGVSIRSLASSRALALGISQADIVTLGNWTSSDTFRNHYLRDHMATVDFTSTVLSDDTTDNVFVDAFDSLSLD
ncbi:hypothetical protein [Parasitella parasitica]|uniref:Integrase SAM-like N-terminal domain-containing protein n=1 Tax=Parasitella parasitica TaxID=35722 RepID=A0A0B7NS38_9FUNG|nr:hypothetical protein [Parasitella parasitica]